jgi:hypothetical protein
LKDERFQNFVARVGKKAVKDLLDDLTKIPAHDVDRSYYSDWGDPREFTLADMGVGECAGEVVSQAEFTLAASERELFEAQLLLDSGHSQHAVKAAYASMVRAAQGLVKDQNPAISENDDQIIAEFTRRFYDTQLFWDKYAGGKFAEYLFKAKEFVGAKPPTRPRRAVAPKRSCSSTRRMIATTSARGWPAPDRGGECPGMATAARQRCVMKEENPLRSF